MKAPFLASRRPRRKGVRYAERSGRGGKGRGLRRLDDQRSKIASCNCDYGCPCSSTPRPRTRCARPGGDGDRGWPFRRHPARRPEVRLSLPLARTGARGRRHRAGFIDERADAAQRDALIKILSGLEQEPTTAFSIYGSTIEKEYEPVFTPIDFRCDMETRTGGFVVPGYLELSIEPIRNPVTGQPHRAQIRCPRGSSFAKPRWPAARSRNRADQVRERQVLCVFDLRRLWPQRVIALQS